MTWTEDIKKAKCFTIIAGEHIFKEAKCYAQAQVAVDQGLEFKILLKDGVAIPDDYPLPESKDKLEIYHWGTAEELNHLLTEIYKLSEGEIVNIKELLDIHHRDMPGEFSIKFGKNKETAIEIIDDMCSRSDRAFYMSIFSTLDHNIKLGRDVYGAWKGALEGTLHTAYFDSRVSTDNEIQANAYLHTMLSEFVEADVNESEDKKLLQEKEIQLLNIIIDDLKNNKEPKILYKVLATASASLLHLNKDNRYKNCFLIPLAYFLARCKGPKELMKQQTAFHYKHFVSDPTHLAKTLRGLLE